MTPDEIQKTFSQIAPTVSVVPIFSGSHEVRSRSRNDVFISARTKTLIYSLSQHTETFFRVLSRSCDCNECSEKFEWYDDERSSYQSNASDRGLQKRRRDSSRVHALSEYKDTIDLIDRAPLHELWDLMADFNMIPEKAASELLQRDPKLAHAVLQAQIRLWSCLFEKRPKTPVCVVERDGVSNIIVSYIFIYHYSSRDLSSSQVFKSSSELPPILKRAVRTRASKLISSWKSTRVDRRFHDMREKSSHSRRTTLVLFALFVMEREREREKTDVQIAK